MIDWVQGVDASFDILDPIKAANLKAAGRRVFMQCLWDGTQQPAPRVENLRVAVQAGLYPVGYSSLTHSGTGRYHVEQGRAGVPDDLWNALLLVPSDIELPGILADQIRDSVEATFQMGKRRSIYTSIGHWQGQQQNNNQFGDCLLFNAYWDQNPDIDFTPYGGWKSLAQVVCEQYTGGEDNQGIFSDRDVFNLALLVGEDGMNEEVQAALDAQRKEYRELVGALYGNAGKQWETINALGQGLAAVAQATYTLQTRNGDANTAQFAILDEMEAKLAAASKAQQDYAARLTEVFGAPSH